MKLEHVTKSSLKKNIKKKQNLFKFDIIVFSYFGYDLKQEVILKISNEVIDKTVYNEKKIPKLSLFFKLFFFFFFLIFVFFLYEYLNFLILNQIEENLSEVIFLINNTENTPQALSFNKKFYATNLYFNSLMLDLFKIMFK